MSNFTNQIALKPSGSNKGNLLRKGGVLFGNVQREYGPANPDLVGEIDTGFRHYEFVTGSGSFAFFEIPTKIFTEEFDGGVSSTNTPNANPATNKIAIYPPGQGGNPILTEIVMGELNTNVSESLARFRGDNSPLTIYLEQQPGNPTATSGSYRVNRATLINTNKTRLDVSTIWASDSTYSTGGGRVFVTFITSSVQASNPDQAVVHYEDNREDFINFYKNRSTYFQTTASVLQHVIDEVAMDSGSAIIAATDWDDDSTETDTDGLSIGINYEGFKTTQNEGDDFKQFKRLYGPFSPFTGSAACDWVCLKNSTAEIGRPYNQTIVKSIRTGDKSIVSQLTANTSPNQTTTSTLTAGFIIQSNKPTSVQNQGDNSCFAPLNYAGTILGWRGDRYFPVTIRLFCTKDNTEVKLWKNVNEYINTYTGDFGDIISITLTEADWDEQWAIFRSNHPIVGTSNGSSNGDSFVLPVVAAPDTPMYRQRNPGSAWTIAMDGTQPDTNNTYAISDPTGCVTITRGDGDGGDGCGGLSTDFLTNRYAFGQGKLLQYAVVSGYEQDIKSYYYDSGWQLFATHNTDFNGATVTNPKRASTGSLGSPRVPLKDLTTVWKWEADQPFFLFTNDGSADEEVHIGWNNDQSNIAISY